MKREFDVLLQQGHVARKVGSTGTSGHRGSEQDFVIKLGPMIRDRLLAGGLTVKLIGADDPRPTAEVFLALHQDGSINKGVHGASTGFPIHGDGETLVKIWKARYTKAGWPFDFRRSNYTVGEHYYYAFGGLRRWWWKRAKFAAAFLIEHGFASTVTEENWMWDHFDEIADADANTILQYFGKLPPLERFPKMLIQGSNDKWRNDTAVADLQRLLNMFSSAGLVVDGDFGPATRTAVIAYQKKLHVSPVNGVWGASSMIAHEKFMQYLKAQVAPVETAPKPPIETIRPPVTSNPPPDPLMDILARLKEVTADLETHMAGRTP